MKRGTLEYISPFAIDTKSTNGCYTLDFFFNDFCPRCGNTKLNFSGTRKNKFKEHTRRFKCLSCGYLFSNGFDCRAHFPLWVWDKTLFNLTLGVRPAAIPQIIYKESVDRNLQPPIRISKVTVYHIVRRTIKELDKFERNIRLIYPLRKIQPHWKIDDRFHNFKIPEFQKAQLLKFNQNENDGDLNGQRFIYATAVLEAETRYCLACFVSLRRDVDSVVSALGQAQQLVSYTPELFICDGHKPFVKAIKSVYPKAKVIAKTKKEDISIVNEVETFWSMISRMIPKNCFRNANNLREMLNLSRHDYNIRRTQKVLGNKTPLEATRFMLPPSVKSSWINLLNFAWKVNRLIDSKKLQIRSTIQG